MEAKYDEMTESEEEREVAKLTPAQKNEPSVDERLNVYSG